jgi:Actin like proteins N terminal domain/Archaeal actin homologue MreB-like, C-terminal
MYNTYAGGMDYGNGESKMLMYVDGVGVKLKVPSYTAPANIERFHALDNRLVKSQGDFIYSDAQTEQYVGKLATEQKSPYNTAGQIMRYSREQAKQIMLTMSAALVDDREYGFILCSGLPVLTYMDNKLLRGQIIDMLSGSYEFKLNGEPRIAHVRVGKVLMEGHAAMANLTVGKSQTTAIVDIGSRTTDMVVVRGQKAIESLCQHRDIGVSHPISKFNAAFERTYRRPLLSYELAEVSNAYAHGESLPMISVSGKVIDANDVQSLLEQSFYETWQVIESFIASVWNQSESGAIGSSFNQIYVIGGGYYHFKGYIEALLRHSSPFKEPEYANCQGYAKVANLLLEQGIEVRA